VKRKADYPGIIRKRSWSCLPLLAFDLGTIRVALCSPRTSKIILVAMSSANIGMFRHPVPGEMILAWMSR